MRLLSLLLMAPLLLNCQTTQEAPEPDKDGIVTIPPDDLEPMRRLVLETPRVLVADFVRVEASRQLFESQMGIVADRNFVVRQPTQLLADGSKLIILKNINTAQTSNIDPDLLPRVYFGESGLQIRAYNELRIYLRNSIDRNRPLFLNVQARNAEGRNAKLWVSGRLQHDKPKVDINSAMIWDETVGRYKHTASIG